MPSPGIWISPRHTGATGQPSTKHDTMSVPPEIEASCACGATCSYTKSKPSGESGDPVERIARTDERSFAARGETPDLATASIHFADVPNTATRSRAAHSNSAPIPGCDGEPS